VTVTSGGHDSKRPLLEAKQTSKAVSERPALGCSVMAVTYRRERWCQISSQRRRMIAPT